MTDAFELQPLAPGKRFLGELIALGVFLAGTPGMVDPGGWPILCVLGLAGWAAFAARPLGERKWRARLGEWVAGGITVGAVMFWSWYVWPPTVLYMAAGFGLYTLLAAAVLRVLARRLPLALALPLAWNGVETLRSAMPLPFGVGWLRLGHTAHEWLWFSGSARLWGIEGIGFALAAVAGLLAALAIHRRLRPVELAAGLVPAALAVVLSFGLSAPDTVVGPRVLIVQPGFSQERKQTYDPDKNFAAQVLQTERAVEQIEQDGQAPPDLVCWGESMLFTILVGEGLVEAYEAGLQLPPWYDPITAEVIAHLQHREGGRVGGALFGFKSGDSRLPPGTSFLSGAEVLTPVGEELRRRNAVVLYGPNGRRKGTAGKRYLVPGGETMHGLEAWDFIRDGIHEIAGYVPDLVADDETGILELETRDGRTFRMGATVCFDNAYLPPYTDPLAAPGGLDFHVVASNEAWYLESAEVDQMMAFSRLIALSTGRAVVRATNSGISAGIAPDGTELGRIVVDGKDRLVQGELLLDVPVPAGGPEAGIPPYVRLRLALRILLLLAPLALLVLFRAPRGNPSSAGG